MEYKELNIDGRDMNTGISEEKFIRVPVPMVSQDGERFFTYVSLPKDYKEEDHRRMMNILAFYVKEDKKNSSDVKTSRKDVFLPDFNELARVTGDIDADLRVNAALDTITTKKE
ncbi:hypothetical protein J0B02_00190 [Enterobacteriaceae bacterium YMB-R22]|jgi:hypothetical protein|uniref:hypothetical protein n=1 Tax=Tenebrionicola larvae TaxID=2815733 RepID=UPI0020127D59|nr:hypothetical protein [Tenebrionicola larvae]MBV4411277.1 hypothetical protein [Tenebrionicola larvae]